MSLKRRSVPSDPSRRGILPMRFVESSSPRTSRSTSPRSLLRTPAGVFESAARTRCARSDDVMPSAASSAGSTVTSTSSCGAPKSRTICVPSTVRTASARSSAIRFRIPSLGSESCCQETPTIIEYATGPRWSSRNGALASGRSSGAASASLSRINENTFLLSLTRSLSSTAMTETPARDVERISLISGTS